jgi:spore coat protein CotH
MKTFSRHSGESAMHSMQIVAFVMLVAGTIAGAGVDSSGVLFDDAKIHAYELQFYCPGWQDSLTYYYNLDEAYIPARFVCRLGANDSMVLDSVGVRYKGNSSYSYAAKSPKKPFKFSFDEYRSGRTFFGVKKLNFSNGAKDPTMMREKISYDIIRRSIAAPRAAFATISIEGKLIGLYTQVEQVDKIFLDRAFKDNNGNLYKSSDDGSTLLYRGQNQSSYEGEYQLKTNTSQNDWSAFIAMVDKLNNTADADFVKNAGGCIALDILGSYLAFNMVFSNFDSYTGSGRNFYLYDDPTSKKFILIPWDLNLSFGGYPNGWNVSTADVITTSNLAQRPLMKRIVGNDSLRQVYLRHIKAMIDGPAMPDSVAAMADRWKSLIDSTAQTDSNKLHAYADFVKNITSDVSVVDGISRVTIPGLSSFCAKRAAALRTQLASYLPVISRRSSEAAAARLTCSIGKADRIMRLHYTVSGNEIDIRIELFSIQGRLAHLFYEGKRGPGSYELVWDTDALPAGYYLLKSNLGSERGAIGVILTKR